MSGKDHFKIAFYKRPKCSLTYKIWNEWVEAARGNSPGVLGFCGDCTKEYALEMRSINMCEHTYVQFDSSGEAFVSDEDKLLLRKESNGQ